MSPDSETESCGSGTMAPEWEPDKTADLMIGTLTFRQHGTTVLQHFKITHVISADTICFWPLNEQLTMV